jgi:hypothetical protein
MPTPPINRKNEKIKGPGANADPIDDTVNKIPIQISIFFLPYFWVRTPPAKAPKTVPHNSPISENRTCF